MTTHGDGTDLAIVSFANGLHLSLQAQKQLAAQGVAARVIDLHWLSPLPEDALVAALEGVGDVLIVDETRRTGGLAEALMSLLTERTDVRLARDVAQDSFIPTGPAYAATMPSVTSILAAAAALLGSKE